MPPENDRSNDDQPDLMDEYRLVVEQTDQDTRIDRYLASQPELGLSRNRIQELISRGLVRVDGMPTKSSYPVKPGDRIWVGQPEPEVPDLSPQSIPLDIVYEDHDILVLNKQRGLVVHPAPGHPDHTLVNALLAHCDDLTGVGDELRPGIVHRLDKDTTGVMVVAKNDRAHRFLTHELAEREVHRTYLALVHGSPPVDRGLIDAPIGRDPHDRKKMAVNLDRGRDARTYFTVRERFTAYTLVECRLETGRTHQIRVHLSYIGHPVVCDTTYGPSSPPFECQGQLLHAYCLKLTHPTTGELMTFQAPLPDDMQGIVDGLRGAST